MNYQKINNLTGWLVFALSLLVYVLTLEPTASFWDCGEFIAVARHLQTPHPPGAPIFSLLGRVFSMFSGDGWSGFSFSEDAAYWINMLSAVSGAATSLFLFWSITILGKKLLKIENQDETSLGDRIAIFGAGFVGAMACTFCDSLWFSAVEAEVYAISVFFTAFVLWAMLKRSTLTNQTEKDRWMILIAYMMGLSIGVHLLNLVAIPAMAFIVYFENSKPTLKGSIITFLTSAVILLVILSGLPGLTSLAFWFDRTFVGMGLPFNTGAFFFLAAIIGGLVYGIMYSIQKNKRILNVALLSTSFILIGFFSYFLIIIRSQQNPTIDENNPEDLAEFISYLKREQYGDRPLFFGPQYNIDLQDAWRKHIQAYGQPQGNFMTKEGSVKYKKEDNAYVAYDTAFSYVYPPEAESFLPRMYDPSHERIYSNLIEQYNDGYYPSEYYSGERISFTDNIKYFFDRQLGRMYFRYFLWNFKGRERQEQYAGTMSISSPSNAELPQLIRHPARNNFFSIPLIIGLIGLLYHFFKDHLNFTVVLTLFVLTGMAIIFYLNAPPVEPRERDYAYAGSYMAFCIWIGLAVIAIYEMATKAIKNKLGAASIGLIICLTAPSIMAAVGWDDHDRSKRYFSVDSAKNLLNSCAENAILFTAGDNDTFPLWYVQEVEGFRTDVRVCNLSLLNTDWYTEQMSRKAHKSMPLPITFSKDDYLQGSLDFLPFKLDSRKNISRQYYKEVETEEGKKTQYISSLDPGFSLDKYITLVREKSNKVIDAYGSKDMECKIARKFIIPVDSAAVAKLDWIPANLKSKVVSQMTFDNGDGALYKKDLIMLDIINSVAKNGWDRPIYFSTTAGQPGGDNFQGIKEYLQQEALAYRLIPASGYGQMNDEMTHKILTTGYKNGAIERKFSYRGLADTTITYTDDYDRMVYGTQAIFIQLAMNYVDTKQIDKAKQLLNDYNKNISDRNFPWGHLSPAYLNVIYDVYGNERGDQEYEKMAKLNFDVIAYYISSGDDSDHRREHIENALRILGSNGFSRILAQKNRTNILPKHLEKTKKIAEALGYQNI